MKSFPVSRWTKEMIVEMAVRSDEFETVINEAMWALEGWDKEQTSHLVEWVRSRAKERLPEYAK